VTTSNLVYYIASFAVAGLLGFVEYSVGWLIPISFFISLVVYTAFLDVGAHSSNTDKEMVGIVIWQTLLALLFTGFVYWLGSLFN
jgi:hypothetical protein